MVTSLSYAPLVHHATNAWVPGQMLLQRKLTIMSYEDSSVQIPGAALFIAVARNEHMHAQGYF